MKHIFWVKEILLKSFWDEYQEFVKKDVAERTQNVMVWPIW